MGLPTNICGKQFADSLDKSIFESSSKIAMPFMYRMTHVHTYRYDKAVTRGEPVVARPVDAHCCRCCNTGGVLPSFFFFVFSHTSTFQLLDKAWPQVLSLLPPGSCLQFFIAHRVQQSHCSSIFNRVWITHALTLSASQFVHKKSPHEFIRACTRGDSNPRN